MQQTQLLLSVSFIKYDFAELPTNNLFKFNEVLHFEVLKVSWKILNHIPAGHKKDPLLGFLQQTHMCMHYDPETF